MDIFQLFISAIFVNNIVLAQYLGNCPYLGCSKEKGVALGMGGAVIFVIIEPNSPATKCRIKEMGLPEDTIIGGIVRGDKVFIAVDNSMIQPYDRVVVFSMPESVSRVGYFFN